MPIIPADKLDDPNYQLLVAASDGLLDVLKKLITNGANIHHCDEFNGTALSMAVMNGHIGCVRYLVEHGADLSEVDLQDMTFLHIAAMNGHLECVRYLVEQGMDLLATDAHGETPLTNAQFYGHHEVAELIQGYLKSKREFEQLNDEIHINKNTGSIQF